MISASILLTNTAINSGSPVKLLCNGITPSGNKNNVQKPDANGDALVEVQTQSYENLKYTILGLNITGQAGTLTYNDILTLYTQKYNGSNYSTLNVTYGDGSVLNGLSGSTDIKVIMEGQFNMPFNVTQVKNAAIPKGSITFRETL